MDHRLLFFALLASVEAFVVGPVFSSPSRAMGPPVAKAKKGGGFGAAASKPTGGPKTAKAKKKTATPAGFGGTSPPAPPPTSTSTPPPAMPQAETGDATLVERASLAGSRAPQFMGAFRILDEAVVDGVLRIYDDAAPVRGMVSAKGGGAPLVDTAVKDSLETSVAPNDPRPAWRAYMRALRECAAMYCEDYPYAAAYGVWSLSSRTNIQRYPPGGGYKTYHTERTGAGQPEGSRHLVFMTYLDDVTDAGGTQFYHQNLTVAPVKGLTLIWPADWTFTHRGVPSPTQQKTITTGWFNYV